MPTKSVVYAITNKTNFNEDFSPVSGLVIQIANVTRLALVTVAYNWKLDISLNETRVYYDQRSLEPRIDFNWTLVKNYSNYLEI